MDVIHHNLFTNQIAYLMLAFDCKKVPDELLPYVGLLSSVLGLMDTHKHTYPELTNEININSGGIATDAAIYTDSKDFQNTRSCMKSRARFYMKNCRLYWK